MVKKIQKHLPGLIVLSIVLAPEVNYFYDLPVPLRFEDILIILGLCAVAGFLKGTNGSIIRKRRIPRLFLVLGFSGLIGLCVGSIFLDYPIIMRDFFFLPQILKYTIIYWLFLKLVTTYDAEKSLFSYCGFSALLCAIIGVAQYWNLLSINVWLTPLYESHELLLSQMVNQIDTMNFRVPGTMGNPNYYGYILAWLTCWILSFKIYSPDKFKAIICTGILSLIALSVLLTQSRSTFFIFGIIFIMTIIFSRYMKSSSKILLILLVVVAVSSLFYLAETSYMTKRDFGARLSFDSESFKRSLHGRVRDLVKPIEIALESPFIIPFGQGPSKAVLRSDSHNGYTWMMQRFGLLGLWAYLSILFFLSVQAYRTKGLKTNWPTGFVSFSVFLCCGVWFIADFAGNIFKEPRLMSLNMVSAGWFVAHLNGYYFENRKMN